MTDELISVVAKSLGVDPTSLSEASSMGETLGWDSLRQLILISEIERSFGVKFSFQEMSDATSIALLRQLVEKKKIT